MIALEHFLILLLLLVALLYARPRLHVLAQSAIVAGLALAFVAPAWPIALPWDWLSALLIPLLFWQTARHLVSARWRAGWVDLGLWLFVTMGIGAMLSLTTNLGLTGAVLFGLLAASMMWRAMENRDQTSHLGQLGPLALAFLLAEIAPAVESPDLYLGSLLSGAGISAVVSYAGVQVARRIGPGWKRALVSLGQVYLAYVIAWWIGASAVTAAWAKPLPTLPNWVWSS